MDHVLPDGTVISLREATYTEIPESEVDPSLIRESSPNHGDFIECKNFAIFPNYPSPLSESTLTAQAMQSAAADVIGAVWNTVIIEACVSDNSNWYRGSVLRESAPVFEGANMRIYTYEGRPRKDGIQTDVHHDHMPGWLAARDAGHVTGNTVGAYRNVKFGVVPSQRTPGAYAEAVLAEAVFIDAVTRERIKEAHQRGLMKPHGRSLFELSIEASGPHKVVLHESGKQVRMVESISSVREVTIVSEGAAGGRFIGMVESKIQESPRQTTGSESTSIGERAAYVLNAAMTNTSIGFDALKQNFLNPAKADACSPDNPSPQPASLKEAGLSKIGHIYGKNDALPGANYLTDDALNAQSAAIEEQNPGQGPEPDMIPQFGDDDIGQIRKAADVLRSGNQTLGIEILNEIIVKHDEQEGQTDCQPCNVNGVKKSISNMKREAQSESTQSSNVALKEPERMPHLGTHEQESEGLGSAVATHDNMGSRQNPQSYQQLQESRQFTDNDILDFARTIAQRDAERDVNWNRLLESHAEQGRMIQQQQEQLQSRDREMQLRECASLLRTKLRESGLPQANQTVIAEQFSGKIFKEAVLTNTVNRHLQLVNQLAESFAKENGIQIGGVRLPGQLMSGSSRVSAGRSAFDSIRAEFDRAMGYDPSVDATLTESERANQREIWKTLPRRASLMRPMGIWHGDMDYTFNGQTGPNALLREAAGSADLGLAVLLQNSMTKSVMQRFMLLPAQYREIAEIVPAANFLEHQVIVTGGLGLLPRVTESKTGYSYLTLGFPSNFQTKYTVGTFGGLINVTRQAIINDNLQEIQEYPKRAAESAMMTLNLYVFGTLIGMFGTGSNGSLNSAKSYDGVEYYHDNHFNKTVGAMSYDELVDMQNRLFEQRTFGNATTLHVNIAPTDTTLEVTADINDFTNGIKAGDMIQVGAEVKEVQSVNTSTNVITVTTAFASAHVAGPDTLPVFQLSTPIAFDKRTLIVPTQLGHKAYQLLASTLIPDLVTNTASALNPAYANGALRLLQLHSMYLKNDKKNYYMAAGKPIRWAFLGGRETPEVMLKDNPLVDNVFSGDLISWKVRHEHGGVMMSHLMVQAGLV